MPCLAYPAGMRGGDAVSCTHSPGRNSDVVVLGLSSRLHGPLRESPAMDLRDMARSPFWFVRGGRGWRLGDGVTTADRVRSIRNEVTEKERASALRRISTQESTAATKRLKVRSMRNKLLKKDVKEGCLKASSSTPRSYSAMLRAEAGHEQR